MKLKAKLLKVKTGGPLIGVINSSDAKNLDLLPGDRISIHKNQKHITLLIDITEDLKYIPKGNIGIFEEILKHLNIKESEKIELTEDHKPDSLKLIKKKLDGHELNKVEIDRIIKDLVHHHISEFEASYFIAGCYIHGMSIDESAYLTEGIVNNSSRLKIKNKNIVVDKHCSGGVPNNRTTLLIVPIIAAAGLTVPKTSTRSITSPAGTSDTMEIFAPVEHSKEEIQKIVEKTNGCLVWGGTGDLASADDLLIKLEKPLDLDPEGILLASILAKKSAVNSTHILIDLPYGENAKHTYQDARKLSKKFTKLGKKLKMKIRTTITEGNDVIGSGIGPALEARDIMEIFEGSGPEDLKKKSIKMADILLGMARKKRNAKKIFESGLAEKKFREIIKFQGGNHRITSKDIKIGDYNWNYSSPKTGKIKKVNIKLISRIAKYSGAPQDKGSGIYMHKKRKDKIKKDETIFTIYSETKEKLEFAKKEALNSKIFEIK